MDTYESFTQDIYKLTGVDLSQYKEKQMKRRIDSMITKNNYGGYNKYVEVLRKDKDAYEEFMSYITINVSEFFRNADQWELLRSEVLPYLFGKFGKKIKIWSAACSTGEEPYSLVMLLSDFMPLSDIKIYATDLDKQVVAKAKAGIYSEKSIATIPKKYVDKYFTKHDAHSYKISDEIINRVEFKLGNLLGDEYPKDFDLIVCRNVLIYFTEDAKIEVYKKFNKALKSGGVLFIGSTEQIIGYAKIGYESYKSFFYRKP